VLNQQDRQQFANQLDKLLSKFMQSLQP
jgi:uncharacterized protein YaiI (UPF0178 family)